MPNNANSVSHVDFEALVRRAEEADGPQPDLDKAHEDIIDAADAEVIDADAFSHSPIGEFARQAQEMVQNSGIDFGPGHALPPEARDALTEVLNPMHDMATRVSNLAHTAHDAMIEAAADDDIHDAGADTGSDHDDDHVPAHAPDPAVDHTSDNQD